MCVDVDEEEEERKGKERGLKRNYPSSIFFKCHIRSKEDEKGDQFCVEDNKIKRENIFFEAVRTSCNGMSVIFGDWKNF